jgi:hypothetical protein
MSEVDQEFVSDIFSLLLVTFKSFVWRWPGHLDLILKLQGLEEQRVSVIEMRALFPGSTHVSTLIPIQPRPTVERVKLVECIEPGNRSLISTPAFYAPLPYRTEHCYYCPLLMTLSGLLERTWVSIVSYYRGFEPISRVIIKESTKPTAIERQLTKQYDKQCHIMRQLSDLHASVSDLRACVQQQVPEIDRVC